jgi:hypothetical protein
VLLERFLNAQEVFVWWKKEVSDFKLIKDGVPNIFRVS